MLENSILIETEEEKKKIYDKIDHGMAKAFISGAIFGTLPYMGDISFFLIMGVGAISLVLFYYARISGLKFLFSKES